MRRICKVAFSGKRASIVMVAVVSFGLFCYMGAQKVTIAHFASRQVNAIPFLLKLELHSFENGETNTLFSTKTVARRTDGTTAIINGVGPIQKGISVRKITYMDGRSITISDSVASKTTVVLSEIDKAILKQSFDNTGLGDCSNDAKEIFLGNEIMLGYRVSIYRRSVAEHKELIVWRAPELSCEDLKYVVDSKVSGRGYTRVMEARPVIFSVGEPEQAYFEIDSSYAEVKPSEAMDKIFKKMGIAPGINDLQRALKLDERYFIGR